jgi:hypothetical protein
MGCFTSSFHGKYKVRRVFTPSLSFSFVPEHELTSDDDSMSACFVSIEGNFEGKAAARKY